MSHPFLPLPGYLSHFLLKNPLEGLQKGVFFRAQKTFILRYSCSSVSRGIAQLKMKICSNFTYSQGIQDVDEFVSALEKIWRNLAYSPMDPLQWMGAIRMRVQTADKNITIIHM